MTSKIKVDKIVSATGTDTTLGESGGTVTLADGATAVGFGGNSNIIINSGFDIWQRGTSFTSTSVNEYSADRWRTEGNGHNTTISRQSFASGQTDVPNYPTYFCRIASSSTVASGLYWAFQQRVERPQFMSGHGEYTLSFWVKSTAPVSAGAFSFGITGGTLESSPALTTSWQKVTATRTITESGSNVSIYIVRLGQGQGNITVDIADVQLEVGSVANSFQRRNVAEELALCQRYYIKSYDHDDPPGTNTEVGAVYDRGPSADITNRTVKISFPVNMRGNPTCTAYSISGTSGAISDCASSFSEVSIVTGSSFHGTQGRRSLSKVTCGTPVNDMISLHFAADAEL